MRQYIPRLINIPFHCTKHECFFLYALPLVTITAPQSGCHVVTCLPLMITAMSGDSMSVETSGEWRWETQIEIQPNWIFMINALITFHPHYVALNLQYTNYIQVASCVSVPLVTSRHRPMSLITPQLGVAGLTFSGLRSIVHRCGVYTFLLQLL